MGSHTSRQSGPGQLTKQFRPIRPDTACHAAVGVLGGLLRTTSRFPAPASACAGITYKSTRKNQADLSRQETHWSETLTSSSTFLMRR